MISLSQHIANARKLVSLMDTKFSIFGIKFGIDPLLDIIPWLGDAVGMIVSCYLFFIAYRLNVPFLVYVRMTWNIVFDYVLGLIPVIGIIADLFYRSNLKNLALLEKYITPSILTGEIVDKI